MLEKVYVSNLLSPEVGFKPRLSKVAIVSNHVPRRCGLATFASDLADGLEQAGNTVGVFAMTDEIGEHAYPRRVRREIVRNCVDSYLHAARQIECDGYEVVSLQHEYGIYGGSAGAHVLALLRNLTIPIVTTLHTILEKPSPEQHEVMEEIVRRSHRVIVMSKRGKDILERVHPSSIGKVDLIAHGVPDGSKVDRREARRAFGLSHRKVVLTFGLLSRDKGIEQMIEAMVEVRRHEPDALFVVVGATHPHVVKHEGEVYRESLTRLVHELELEDHVMFRDEFVSHEELVRWIVSCDVYVCPYLKTEQVTSGTLSFAYGLGKPIVSTPNWHAQELLAQGGGELVPVRDSAALAAAVTPLLARPQSTLRDGLQSAKLAQMQWSHIAGVYSSLFETTQRKSLPLILRPVAKQSFAKLPLVGTSHLYDLTDDVGIMQHGQYSIPRRSEGYCIDDNARALILTLEWSGTHADRKLQKLEKTYMAFVAHAFQPDTKRFHNFMGFDRRWLDEAGSDDSQGRAVWAIGSVAAKSQLLGHKLYALDWLEENFIDISNLRSLRAMAFCLFGIDACSTLKLSPEVQAATQDLAKRFVREFRNSHTLDWPWFEPILSYDNARLPQALLIAARVLKDVQLKAQALESLQWLCRVQTDQTSGCFAPIGSNGFYPKEGVRQTFDQQPLEAAATVDACLAAFAATEDSQWLFEARRAFDWFHGRNMLNKSLVTEDGGCYDGLMEGGVNRNQGAESTIAYLAALCAMKSSRLVAGIEASAVAV